MVRKKFVGRGLVRSRCFVGFALMIGWRPGLGQAPHHRAILVSFDGFSEQRARQFATPRSAPALFSILERGACAEASRPSFPSVTPTGHAAIFTGAYGDVNGVAAQSNGALPLSRTSILDRTNGFLVSSLRAEPIWISAARQGLRVFSHMATQSPGPPAYADTGDVPDPALARERASAAATLAKRTIGAINVYNDLITEARVFTPRNSHVRDARGWTHMSVLGRLRGTPREIAWAFGQTGDSLHALVYSTSGGARALVSATRDAAKGVVVRYAPTDTSSPRGRDLARFFSAPLELRLPDGRRTFEYFRLWEATADLSHFLLYASEARVIQGNRPDVAGGYDAAVRGVLGNGSDFLLERGELGLIRAKGGDGVPEFRYLETAELLTRQYMRGTEWGWRTYRPDLLVDYFPQPDEALHTWLGYADPSTPGVDASARAFDARMIERAYVLIDLRIEQLRRLASSVPGTLLFVTGEHGMRPTWMEFRPNAVLRDAGLLAADSSGRIDLTHTLAVSTDKAWISVNVVSHRGGIVPRDSVSAVLARVERALRSVRDSTGGAVVTQVWRRGTRAADSLGLGGPTGGDLYYGLALGYFQSVTVSGPVIAAMPFPKGEHGFPSTDRDMQPLFCTAGDSVSAHRYGVVRAIDIAPTVSAWLGIAPPADARGISRLDEIMTVRRGAGRR